MLSTLQKYCNKVNKNFFYRSESLSKVERFIGFGGLMRFVDKVKKKANTVIIH